MCFVRGCFCAISLFVCVISFSSACLVRVLHCLWHRILCPHMQLGESVPIRKLVNKSRNKSSQSTSSPPPFSSPAPPLQAGEWKYSFRCCSWARAPRGIVTRQGDALTDLQSLIDPHIPPTPPPAPAPALAPGPRPPERNALLPNNKPRTCAFDLLLLMPALVLALFRRQGIPEP